MSYQTLYSMPCRLPCQRYMNVNSMFEGAVQFVPVPVMVPVAAANAPAKASTKEKFDGGEYEPTVSREGFDGGEYEPTVSREGFEMGESYADVDSEAKCNCSPMNRPYRMESCGYNQSPTWEAHRAFSGPVQNGSMIPSMERYTAPRQMAAERSRPLPGITQLPEESPEQQPDCGCGPANPPYRMEKCGYNQSRTWTDQASFRDTVQNRPF